MNAMAAGYVQLVNLRVIELVLCQNPCISGAKWLVRLGTSTKYHRSKLDENARIVVDPVKRSGFSVRAVCVRASVLL